MTRIGILALAVLPLIGGAAVARGAGPGDRQSYGGTAYTHENGAAGPEAYANWRELWRAQQKPANVATQPSRPQG
jgi:hypothetical protein